MDAILSTLAQLVLWVSRTVMSLVFMLMESLMVPIMQYDNFINHPVVTTGWVVVRDIVNTGFIAVLLVIAFMTMFGISRANWKQQIPTLAIAAIAVNFSKMIVGFFIDIGQVIMTGFVNAIQQVGAGNFMSMMSIDTLEQLNPNKEIATGGTNLFITSLFILSMALVIFVIILTLTAILAWRIVVLWVLIVLSPLAFFGAAAKGVLGPAGSAYGEFWSKLTAAVMVGPLLTFFIWLALAAASGAGKLTEGFNFGSGTIPVASPILSTAFTLENFTGFIIAIALLMIGLQEASKSASAMGGLAAMAASKGTALAKAAAAAPFAATAAAGAWVGRKTVAEPLRAGYKGGVELAADRWRGTTKDWRADSRKYFEQKRVEAIARGGVGGAIQRAGLWAAGGAAGKVIGETEKEKAIRAQLAEKARATGLDTMSDAQIEKYMADNKSSKSEQVQANVAHLRDSVVSDEKKFADFMRRDPAAGRKMLADVQQYKKDIGDEKGTEKIDAMLKRNLAWKHGTPEAMASEWDKMTDGEKRNISENNFESAEFRQALFNTGATNAKNYKATLIDDGTGTDEEKKDIKRRRGGYTTAQLKLIDTTAANRVEDENEFKRVQAERDATRHLDLSDTVNKSRVDANENYHRMKSAEISGTLNGTLKAGGVRLEALDTVDLNRTGVTQNDISSLLQQAIKSSNGTSSIERLRRTADAGNTSVEGDRARVVVGVLDDATVAVEGEIASGAITGGALTAARNNVTHIRDDARQYNYDSGARAFASPEKAREFSVAVAANPTLVLHLESDIEANNGNNQMAREIAEGQSQKSLNELLTRFENSQGSDMEGINREIAETIGRTMEQHLANINRGVVRVPAEVKGNLEKALDHYTRRVGPQLDW